MTLIFNTGVYGLQLGLCYAIAALGMYIAYSILDFPDLTTDGSFPLGGVVGTVLMLRLGFPPLLALVGAFLAGALAGMITGVLHVRFGITKLLSGIIVMTGLLSVTLALTTLLSDSGMTSTTYSYIAGKLPGLFGTTAETTGRVSPMADFTVLLILCLLVLAVKLLLDLFFKTKAGFLLTATGNNEALITSLGKDVGSYKIFGLCLTNGLVAVSGSLYAQLTMNYDNTSGTGKVVLTLASIIIGLAVFSRVKFVKPTTAVIVGALIYSLCLNFLTLIDSGGIYLKLMNAIAFAVILIVDHTLKRQKVRQSKKGISGGEGV